MNWLLAVDDVITLPTFIVATVVVGGLGAAAWLWRKVDALEMRLSKAETMQDSDRERLSRIEVGINKLIDQTQATEVKLAPVPLAIEELRRSVDRIRDENRG